MKVDPECRKTGVVELVANDFRTLTGGQFWAGRKQRIEIEHLLSEDIRTLQAATEPLRYLFPHMEWEEWGIEIVTGHDRLIEVLLAERTFLLERRALDSLHLLGWELFGAFLQAVLEDEFRDYLTPREIPLLGVIAQLSWFVCEGVSWQREVLAFVSSNAVVGDGLETLLWSLLPEERVALLREQGLASPDEPEDVRTKIPDATELWEAALAYLGQSDPTWLSYEPDAKAQQQFQRAFSICSLLPWSAMCSALPGLLSRFFFEIPASASSTDRRLGLFRISVEMGMNAPLLLLDPMIWPRMSALVLDPERHPKIYQALLQFLEITTTRSLSALWPIVADETVLAQLALRNRLSEQDDRFFRQATHIQAIWRDILHRSASQPWASELLFDLIERVVGVIEAEPDLLFAAVIWNRAMWEAGTPIAPPLQNLRELLWVLSQAPLAVLRRLYPEDEAESAEAHERWPLLWTHLKRFLHLAPQILSRLYDQLEEEQGRPANPEATPGKFDVDADPDIPQQELHGRILPLLARPDIQRYRHIELEQTECLRVLHLDRYLHQSSGLWKEHRFFSSFLLFFKTSQDRDEGGWAELALWIDKDLDLGKVINKKGLSSTIRGLLLEDGIWERTYRYQFLTVQQLMIKLNPDATEWSQLLQLLGAEYTGLVEQRLRELLDYQYYMMRSHHLHANALTGSLDDADIHALWRLPVEEFEALKQAIASRMSSHILDDFYRAHLQDDRSWSHAHQAISQRVLEISTLLLLEPGTLLAPGEAAHPLHTLFADVIEQWVEQPDSFVSTMQSSASWMDDKKALLKRLEQRHREGAIDFVSFLMHLFEQPYRVVELLMDRPFEDEGASVIFKPIPTSSESVERQREFVPFLRSTGGQILSPAFLELFHHIPQHLLHAVLIQKPSLFGPLQRVAHLLHEIDRDSEHATRLWDTIEALRELCKVPDKEFAQESTSNIPLGTDASLPKHKPNTSRSPSDASD